MPTSASGRRAARSTRPSGSSPEETEGRLVYELGNGQWDIPELRTLLEDILPKNGSFRDFEVDARLRGHRPAADAPQRPQGLAARESLGTHPARHRGRHRRWRAGVDFADNRERYRVIVEGATGFAIFTFDTEGVITSWNAGAEKMLGYSEAEILGQNFRIIFTPEDLETGQADEEMRTAAAEGRALDERWHLKKGGERFWAQGLVMPLKDDADETRGFLKIIRDKTEERQLEDALQMRTDELEEADRPQERVPGDARPRAEEPARRHPQRRRRSRPARARRRTSSGAGTSSPGRSATSPTSSTTCWTSPASPQGKIQLRKELIDAAPVVRHAVEAVRPLVEERKHELLLSFTSTDLRLEADPTRLEQILVNLLTNAAKYTPAGGRIQLIAGVEGGEVVFRVRDNGVGIPPEMLPRMFDLFAQGDRSLARSEGGLGIGLTLVRSLAELHGGTVTATSDGPGKGSEFVVRLPAADGRPRGPTRLEGPDASCRGPTLAGPRRR